MIAWYRECPLCCFELEVHSPLAQDWHLWGCARCGFEQTLSLAEARKTMKQPPWVLTPKLVRVALEPVAPMQASLRPLSKAERVAAVLLFVLGLCVLRGIGQAWNTP